MKKLLFLFTLFCTLQANAQPYSISFAGVGLSTVKVQNLTTDVIVDVPAGDVLRLSTSTGISEANNIKGSGLKVYPNPMTDKATLEILPPVAGDVIISVYDMTGRVLTHYKGYVENSSREFSLSGIKSGLHIINVQGNGYQFSEKLLSNGKSNGTAIIARVSNNTHAVAEKKTTEDSKGVQAIVDMAYNSGERLKYTAVSGNNTTVMTDIPTADNTVTFTFTECKDGDGNHYPIVQIGSAKGSGDSADDKGVQIWMAINLATTKYNDGKLIPLVTDSAIWRDLITPGYCWYNNGKVLNGTDYGGLYNWYTVNTGKLCPTGWHVPSDAEWTTMETYLIANDYNFNGFTFGNYYAKSLAATTHWISNTKRGVPGNTDFPAYRNKTGFSALPCSCRSYTGSFGNPIDERVYGYWWSSTESLSSGSEPAAWHRWMYYKSYDVGRNPIDKNYGLSVRCVRD